MSLYKRAPFCFFTIEADELLDVGALLQGRLETSKVDSKLFAVSLITSSKYAISSKELDLLLRIPEGDWCTVDELEEIGAEAHQLEEMARHGLLLSDGGDAELSELRRRTSLLDTMKWPPYAALYHFMSRATEFDASFDYVAVEADASERARLFVSEHGNPPGPFHQHPELPLFELPIVEQEGELYELLKRRRTTRSFDATKELSIEDLSTVLYYTFGCHGYLYLAPEILLLSRTSPSGGSLHPVEAYLLIMRVENIAPGIYHYNMYNHGLECMAEYDLKEAQALAVEFGGGQEHMKSAHALFIMTARFHRNFWKYQRLNRSYNVVLMDAAHLSQTLYLIATDLNLGVFFSAAINSSRIHSILGLDGYEEGALALCGCGVAPAENSSRQGLRFSPFIPRVTGLKH